MIELNQRHKLDPLFRGPFKVTEIQHPNVKVVDDKNKEILLHNIFMSHSAILHMSHSAQLLKNQGRASLNRTMVQFGLKWEALAAYIFEILQKEQLAQLNSTMPLPSHITFHYTWALLCEGISYMTFLREILHGDLADAILSSMNTAIEATSSSSPVTKTISTSSTTVRTHAAPVDVPEYEPSLQCLEDLSEETETGIPLAQSTSKISSAVKKVKKFNVYFYYSFLY